MAANDYQVGGDHYKQPPGVPQHWDLSIMYQWDGFQHCITKYLMRWKTKYPSKEKKLEDLKKAAHMLQKYIENYEKFLPEGTTTPAPAATGPGVTLAEYERETNRYVHSTKFRHEGGWGDGYNLYTCLNCNEKIMATGLEHAERVHLCPGPGG